MRTVARRDRAARGKRRLELGQAFERRIGARAFIQTDSALCLHHFTGAQIGGAIGHFNRRHFGRKVARRLRRECALVRLQRKRVLRLTADLPLRGHFLGGEAHAIGDADVLVTRKHQRRERGRVAAHRHHAHALDASGDHDLGFTDADAVGRHLDRRQARGAKTVDRNAAHALGQPGQHDRGARHVEPLLAFRHGAAADQVFDHAVVERRHLRKRRLQDLDQQIIRAQVAEIAAPRTPNGRARGGNDIGFLNLFHISFSPVFLLTSFP